MTTPYNKKANPVFLVDQATGDAYTAGSGGLPSGAATAANQTALAAVIGTVADAAWSGTGDGTVISILKAIAINTTPP